VAFFFLNLKAQNIKNLYEMEKIYLSDSGPKVSQAVYSLWRWEQMDAFDEVEARRIFSLCLNLGINTFEFSAQTKNEHIHKVFFDTISQNNFDRKDLVILASLGKEHGKDGEVIIDQSRKTLINQLNTFLEKTGKEYLDILLLDELDHITDIVEIAGTLDYFVHAGMVRHIGVANFTSSQYRLLNSVLDLPIVTNHLQFNLLNPEAIFDGRLDEIKESFAKPMVWAPLAGGDILEGTNMDNVVIRTALAEIAAEVNSNVEQVAVAWLLNLGMLPIIGSPNEERIRNVAGAVNVQLDHKQWYRIFNIVRKLRK
jgi:predicted oxidoreductase